MNSLNIYSKLVLFVGLLGLAASSMAQTSTIRVEDLSVQTSEFNNHSTDYVLSPKDADPEYEDTEFGEFMYNEASTPTRLEMLRLLSKDTPSMLVFLQALSMGLGIDDVLEAAVEFQSDKGRDFGAAAASILPVIPDTSDYNFGRYDLESLDEEREDRPDEDKDKPIYIERVAERFFDGREILAPFPDWYEGQVHFYAAASELLELDKVDEKAHWYYSDSTIPTSDRPVFVSLYESDKSVLIDGEERIAKAFAEQGPSATVPVVFIYNRLRERAIDQIEDFPHTLKGLQRAFTEQGLMVTPTPEWQNGDYHIKAKMKEVYEIFNIPAREDYTQEEWERLLEETSKYIPAEQDYEPEAWQRLVAESKAYDVSNTSFIVTMIDSGVDSEEEGALQIHQPNMLQLALYDDPRTEAEFPFMEPDGDSLSFGSVLGKGIIINRPDLIAALRFLGVEEIPVAIHYIDSARTKPFALGVKGITNIIVGAGTPPGNLGGGGGFGPPPVTPPPPPPPVCASPPCNN
jgi:hypothetical protein